MSDLTKIEWATATWNPWEGCTKVSPGCLNCYAETRNHRFGMDNWGKGKPRRRTSVANWKKPVQWDKARHVWERMEEGCGRDPGPRPRVFPSLCDWLDDEVPVEWLADFLKLIQDTPNLDWLLLTKRPENFINRLGKAYARRFYSEGHSHWLNWLEEWRDGDAPENVWIGVSVEDQQRAKERIPALLKLPAKVRFLSVEPLLGPVDVSHWMTAGGDGGVDWVIVGGESGPGARTSGLGWIRDVVIQCREAGVPCFVKQLGSKVASGGSLPDKLKAAKGGDPAEWTEDLRVREFPKVNT